MVARTIFIIAALALPAAAACKRDVNQAPVTAKTVEPADRARDEAESALETAREAQETADEALATAREAQAIAERLAPPARSWWTRKMTAATESADRVSIGGQVAETRAGEVVIALLDAPPLVVQIGPATRIAVDGKSAGPSALSPGTELRVLYRMEGGRALAERLDAHR